jgi:hypothetical protein
MARSDREPLKEPEPPEASIPEVRAGFHHYYRGAFDRDGARRVFWSNDKERIVAADLSATVVNHSRDKGKEYTESHHDAVMMEEFEGKNDVPSLDACTMLEPDPLFATTSYSYVRSIRGIDEVVVSVKGSYPTSVFREIEIHEIMNNPEIKNITLLSRDLAASGIVHPKKEAYHYMRDEWLARHRLEYEEALAAGDDTMLEMTRDVLARELAEAKRNSVKDYVFSRGDALYERRDTRYDASDKAKELDRVSRSSDLLSKDGELKRLFDKYVSEGDALTKKQQIVEHFRKKECLMAELDHVVSEAKKKVEAGGVGRVVPHYRSIQEDRQDKLTSLMRAEGVSDAMLLRIREARQRETRIKESMLPVIPAPPSVRPQVSVVQMGSSTTSPDPFFLPAMRPSGPRTSMRPVRPKAAAEVSTSTTATSADPVLFPPIRPTAPRTSLRPTRPGVIATPIGALTTDVAAVRDDRGPTVVDVSPGSLGSVTPTPFNPTRPSKLPSLVKGFRRT